MAIETYDLASELKICRILNGMWQVAGGHGFIEPNAAIQDMMTYHDAGLTTWDMADIYGPAEDLFGEFRRKLAMTKGIHEPAKVVALTKFVPNPGPMSKLVVERAIRTSLAKMDVQALDAVQFHWWDYANQNYLDALQHLTELRDVGKIRHLALTNFDTQRMQQIVEHGFEIISNQVQYSIIDQRPTVKMTEFCKKHRIGLLTYGTLAGGLISEKFLGRPEPTRVELNTLSLQKYKHMIDAWGGWNLFQKLLATLDEISKKHRVSLANVATRYILDKPHVAGVIIGARLGISEHKKDNIEAFSFRLDSDDRARIDEFATKSNDLFSMIGDCGDEYR